MKKIKILFGFLTAICATVMSVSVFAAPATSAAGSQNNMLVSFLPFIILIVAFYFILIRPQKKREKETKSMLNALIPGDEVVTIVGVRGKIVSAKEETVVIETGSDRVKLTFERGAVSRIVKKNEKKSKAAAETDAAKELAKEKEETENNKEE